MANIVFKWLIRMFSNMVDGLHASSRLEKFIFKVVNIVAKITRSGRRTVIALATNNAQLMQLANSS